MNKKLLLVISLFICTLSFGQSSDSISVSYIANSGYFIELGDKNVLIDAVFNQCIGTYSCPDSLLIDRMIYGKYPFEKVDLVLITHNHPDHVSDSLLVEMLNKRSDFDLILSQQVFNSIKSRIELSQFENRVHVIQLDAVEATHIQIKETQIDIARSKHADTYDIENLCFIINDNGFRILHTGDCWPESILDIDSEFFNEVDLAIIPISFGKDRFAVHDLILSPKYTMISHIKTDFEAKFKEIIKIDTATFRSKDVLFEPYEKITYKR